MGKQRFLEAGKIANTHGIGGDVVVESYCDSPEILASLASLYLKKGEEYLPLSIRKANLFKGRVLFHFDGYNTIEEAIVLKNKLLYAERSDFSLAEGSHFVVDLIDLPVFDEDSGECYGVISDVVNYGGSDIYEIRKKDGTKALIPVVPAFVRKIDLDKGVFIHAIEGLI